jgi:HAMP domain-containing protein
MATKPMTIEQMRDHIWALERTAEDRALEIAHLKCCRAQYEREVAAEIGRMNAEFADMARYNERLLKRLAEMGQ